MATKDDVIKVPAALAEFIPEYLELRKADITRLDSALAAGDFELIQKISHGIRGHAKGYGFLRLQEIVTLLENHAVQKNSSQCKELVEQWRVHLQVLTIEIQPDT